MLQMESTLPLRLAVEPYVKKNIKSYFILPTIQEESICYIISHQGLIALAMDKLYSLNEIISKINVKIESLPKFVFVLSLERWFNTSGEPLIEDISILILSLPLNNYSCKAIIDGIYRYYSRQVLEPSIRGFLSILEKTFPRNDLYLFELLQNAVDDGAMNVSFTAKFNQNGSMGGLNFVHNGRPFTALDCLGLSSVGLSTKSNLDSNKRTIGFMGIGFKAVYKRFAKVTIYDKNYFFRFEDPNQPSSLEPPHGWVLKPKWIEDKSELWDKNNHENNMIEDASTTSEWCHFQLEKPRIDRNLNISDDLKYLSITIPALLGRQALENYRTRSNTNSTSNLSNNNNDNNKNNLESKPWILEWNTTTHNVSQIPNSIKSHGNAIKNTSNHISYSISSERIQDFQVESSNTNRKLNNNNINIKYDTKKRYWQFISLRFIPDKHAQDAYVTHTKRSWNNGNVNATEETCLFFEVNESGTPYLFFDIDQSGTPNQNRKGLMHAILPTKLTIPTIMQWQASWLLSVDRQEVQNITDNKWNMNILLQIPKLQGGLLLWASEAVHSFEALNSVYSMLLPIYISNKKQQVSNVAVINNKKDKSITTPSDKKKPLDKLYNYILGIKLVLDDFINILQYSCIVPTISQNDLSKISFIHPNDAIWLPHTFLNKLSLPFLSNWFGLTPIATNKFSLKNVFLPFWKSIFLLPTENLLTSRRVYLKKELSMLSSNNKINLCIDLLVAFGELLELEIPIPQILEEEEDNNNKKKEDMNDNYNFKTTDTKSSLTNYDINLSLCDDWIPKLIYWPIFLNNHQELLSLNEMDQWLSSEFDMIPTDIRHLLIDGIKTSSSDLNILHTDIQDIFNSQIFMVDMDDKLIFAQKILLASRSIITKSFPTKIIHPKDVVFNIFHKWSLTINDLSKDKVERDKLINLCLQIFDYARKNSKPELISHILVEETIVHSTNPHSDISPILRLFPINTVYFSKTYLQGDGNQLENILQDIISIGGKDVLNVLFVSSIYIIEFNKSQQDLKLIIEFLEVCGVQKGVTVFAKCRKINQSEITSTFKEEILPKQRSSPPSCDIFLPYNLGLLSRKDYTVIDIEFSKEWNQIISFSLATNVSKASSFINLISKLFNNLDAAEIVTPITTPVAANALLGKQSNDINNQKLSKCTSISSYTPVFARLFYLPPGQPGASALSVGLASWLKVLATSKWVPAAPPGASSEDFPTLVLSPSEVALPNISPSNSQKSTSPNFTFTSQIKSEMPTIRCSVSVLTILHSLPKVVQDSFLWGTVKPAPPIEKLETIAKKILLSMTSDEQQYTEKLYFDDLVSIWKALANAYQENRLSPTDCVHIKKIMMDSSVNIIPAYNKLWSWKYCWSPTRNISDEEYSTGMYLSKAGFLLNMNTSNVDTNDQTWILSSISEIIITIVQPNNVVLKSIAEEYIIWCSKTCPTPYFCSEIWPYVRTAYSYTFWLIIKNYSGSTSLMKQDLVNMKFSDSMNVSIMKALKHNIPMLKVYCSPDPGVSQLSFPPRWLSVWLPSDDLLTVSPVLIDDLQKFDTQVQLLTSNNSNNNISESGIIRSSLLEAEHNFQPVGILNHSYSAFHCDHEEHLPLDKLRFLRIIDDKILNILKIHRSSNNSSFALKISITKVPIHLEKSWQRLEIVLLLLQVSLLSQSSIDNIEDFKILKNQNIFNEFKTPLLFKHTSLAINFKTPKMIDYQRKQVFAIWGSIPTSFIILDNKNNSSIKLPDHYDFHPTKALMISGEVDDYICELEDLIFNYFCDTLQLKCKIIQKPIKVLRLLSYLEDHEKFMKHFQRNFSILLKKSHNNEEKIDSLVNMNKLLDRLREIVDIMSSDKTVGIDTADKNISANYSIPTQPSRSKELGLSNLPAWLTNPELNKPNEILIPSIIDLSENIQMTDNTKIEKEDTYDHIDTSNSKPMDNFLSLDNRIKNIEEGEAFLQSISTLVDISLKDINNKNNNKNRIESDSSSIVVLECNDIQSKTNMDILINNISTKRKQDDIKNIEQQELVDKRMKITTLDNKNNDNNNNNNITNNNTNDTNNATSNNTNDNFNNNNELSLDTDSCNSNLIHDIISFTIEYQKFNAINSSDDNRFKTLFEKLTKQLLGHFATNALYFKTLLNCNIEIKAIINEILKISHNNGEEYMYLKQFVQT